MSNKQPHDDDQDIAAEGTATANKWTWAEVIGNTPSTADPTLAEFREHLIDAARKSPETKILRNLFQDGIVRLIVRAVDDYAAARTAKDGTIAAARTANGDSTPYNLAPYEDVHSVTNDYEEARDSDDPRALDQFLDNLANDFHLEDVRALRTATSAVQAAMGRIALAARVKGMSPDKIAAETGYTASRITQFIREEKQRLATP
ncbi:hypothetical protein ACH470_23535 [Streptomyces bottropensis]|uniref:hypothetical protein n=1 Tax=Streptomyces bottropensis TaxID=42235 RepID=UPI00378CC145